VVGSGSVISNTSGVAPPGYSLLYTSTQGNIWLTSAPNPKRLNNSADALSHGRIVVLGGDDGNVTYSVFSTVESYDPGTNTWATLPNMPTPRTFLAAVVSNGKLYAVGGDTIAIGGNTIPIVEVYDGAVGTWSTAPSLQMDRSRAAAVDVNGTIYVLGGVSENSSLLALNSVEAYTPPTLKQTSWQAVAPMPTARYALAAAGLNGKLYAISGIQPDPSQSNSGVVSTAVEVYDPASNTWTSVTPIPTGHQGGEARVLNGKIYVVGGSASFNLVRNTNIDIYDPTSNSWSTIVPQQQSGVTYQTQTFDPNVTYFELDGDGDIDHFFGFPIYTYVKN
jgi:large repetitive protein